MGRATGVAVGATSVVVAPARPTRRSITFSVGDSANASSAILKDQIDASATNGFPISFSGGPVTVTGEAASHQWSAIRLAAVDCIVGVIEEFPDTVPPMPLADGG